MNSEIATVNWEQVRVLDDLHFIEAKMPDGLRMCVGRVRDYLPFYWTLTPGDGTGRIIKHGNSDTLIEAKDAAISAYSALKSTN